MMPPGLYYLAVIGSKSYVLYEESTKYQPNYYHVKKGLRVLDYSYWKTERWATIFQILYNILNDFCFNSFTISWCQGS